MGSKDTVHATSIDTGEINNLIENGLLFDWAVKIEFLKGKHETTDWKKWDKTFFAMHSAEPFLASLRECYSENPGCTVRLAAEKFHPQTRLLYQL